MQYSPLHKKTSSPENNSRSTSPTPDPTLQRVENKTGMPDQMKNNLETMSGFDMSDVRVHYNSSKPAQLQAHAYAQGTNIHLASGQEKHLGHEAWHVVQQKQGRVKPTMQLKGINVNDDNGLEREADVMGKELLYKQGTQPLTIQRIENRIGMPDQLKNNRGSIFSSNTIQKLSKKSIKKDIVQRVGNRKGVIDHNNLRDQTPGHRPGSNDNTVVAFNTGTVNWSGVPETVGVHMQGLIGPDHPYGSGPDTSVAQNNINWAEALTPTSNTYFRGHLLNGHLGGPGTEQNLFPISASANHLHEVHVEHEIKTAVNTNKAWVQYRVDVLDRGNGDATFDCRWRYKQTDNSFGPDNRVEIDSNNNVPGVARVHTINDRGPNPKTDAAFDPNNILAQGGAVWGEDVAEIEWSNINRATILKAFSNLELSESQLDKFSIVMQEGGTYDVDTGLTTRQWNAAIRTVREKAGI